MNHQKGKTPSNLYSDYLNYRKSFDLERLDGPSELNTIMPNTNELSPRNVGFNGKADKLR